MYGSPCIPYIFFRTSLFLSAFDLLFHSPVLHSLPSFLAKLITSAVSISLSGSFKKAAADIIFWKGK